MNTLVAWFVTFNFINITWVLFRAKEWDDAMKVLKGMFTGTLVLPFEWKERLDFLIGHDVHFGNWLQSISMDKYTIYWVLMGLFVTVVLKNSNELAERFKPSVLTALYAAVLFLAAASSLSKLSEFLYFNF